MLGVRPAFVALILCYTTDNPDASQPMFPATCQLGSPLPIRAERTKLRHSDWDLGRVQRKVKHYESQSHEDETWEAIRLAGSVAAAMQPL